MRKYEEGKVVGFLFGTVVDESSRLAFEARLEARLVVLSLVLLRFSVSSIGHHRSCLSLEIMYRLCFVQFRGKGSRSVTNCHRGLRPESEYVSSRHFVKQILHSDFLPSISFSSSPGYLRYFLSSFACWLPGLVESRTCWSIRCLVVCLRRMFLRGA